MLSKEIIHIMLSGCSESYQYWFAVLFALLSQVCEGGDILGTDPTIPASSDIQVMQFRIFLNNSRKSIEIILNQQYCGQSCSNCTSFHISMCFEAKASDLI